MKDPFKIDVHNLDKEWEHIPEEIHQVTVAAADARAENERSKTRREVTVAELDRLVRRAPETFGIAKITEPVVEKTVLLQKRYKDVNEEAIRAKHALDVAQADVDRAHAKKSALEHLVKLFLADYFGQPSVKGAGSQAASDYKIEKAFGPDKKRRREGRA